MILLIMLPVATIAEDLVVGMSAAFSGPSRSLGIELYRGSQAYLKFVNDQGGVHGRHIIIKSYDDAYDPTRAIQNTIQLVEKDQVFLLFNYVGTPTVTRALPLIKQYAEQHVYLFFPFTGAEPQRRAPYSDRVFNLRASYHDETAALVRQMIDQGKHRIGVFYQADAYGRGGWEGVRNSLRDQGLAIHAEATYHRGQDFKTSVSEQVNILRQADTQAVIAVCAYAACAAFIREARDVGWEVPVMNLSFSGSEAMAELLQQASQESGVEYSHHLVTSQVVPSYQNTNLAAIREYRLRMDELGPQLPGIADASAYEPQRYSFTSLEGYLNARLLVEALQRLGPQPQRSDLPLVMESIQDLDLGIGVNVSFSADRHQGLDQVYFTTLQNGQFVPVTDWNAMGSVAN